MISSTLTGRIDDLVRRSQGLWLEAVCAALSRMPESADAESVIGQLPETNNGDVALCVADVIRQAQGVLSWKALGVSLEVSATLFASWKGDQNIELLWTGPSPPNQVAARRIDQVLYDLIATAQRDILLVTFAAHRVSRLTDGLAKALDRGVNVRLILEFEETSQGQLSMDALGAFPEVVRQRARIYYWPLDKRERNSYGKPGKLHAKVVVVDNQAVMSSANLTDDAFNRNLELGALISSTDILNRLREHFDTLCANGTLKLWRA